MSRRGRPMKKRKFMWSDAATDRLVKMWVDKSDQIKGYGRHTLIHQEMAKELKDYGPTPTEIKAKLDCMKKRYRRELGRMVSMQDVSSDWRYFDSLHHIFKHEHARAAFRNNDSVQIKKEEDSYEDEASENSIDFFYPGMEAEEEADMAAEMKSEADTETGTEPEIEHEEHEEPIPKPKYYKRKKSLISLERERLAVQKETLNVMRSMVREMSNFHASFLITYKKQKKRST
ncbi:uncharacterized protein Dana_GF10838 [Drosophila ananassae]|uniref:Myb/SANT-like DNA-binding domain-containing protein n=1 Tax=Drosophila ananassae TaxID=7217 RepID=B3M8S7_DROAN|nr:uncharacterized protein LOC6493705 [Drosophila ananassae]EDV41078.2 uncharacterized protein Dana_GF10838 [Drosophila ananassae]